MLIEGGTLIIHLTWSLFNSSDQDVKISYEAEFSKYDHYSGASAPEIQQLNQHRTGNYLILQHLALKSQQMQYHDCPNTKFS